MIKFTCPQCGAITMYNTGNVQTPPTLWCSMCAVQMVPISFIPIWGGAPIASHINPWGFGNPLPQDPFAEPERPVQEHPLYEMIKAAADAGLTQDDIDLAVELKRSGVTREHVIMISVFKEKLDEPKNK